MADLHMFVLIFLALFGYALCESISSDSLVEQLFLDYSIQDVLNPQNGLQVAEPWAGMYIQAIRDGRYGDAVWARYHIEGDVHDGIIGDTNTTVLEMIEEDATEYRVNAPEQYAEALTFYEKTSSADQHANVTEIISRVGHENITDLHARVTYSTTCSRRNLAYKSSCLQLIRLMSTQRALIGDRRDVYTYNSCRLRIGPYRSAPDLSYNTAHIVARLIEDDCGYVPSGSQAVFVSGWSPRNSGHRKVCLSSKRTGCS